MSTPIFRIKRHLGAFGPLAAALVLGGCNLSTGNGVFADRAPTRLALETSGIVLAGPNGYCVDRSSVRESEDGVFAILGSCASITGRPNQPKPHYPGLISVSLGPALSLQESVDSTLLAGFIQSDRGDAVMAAQRASSDFRTLDMQQDGPVSYVYVEDKTVPSDSGLENTYWRAVFFVSGRLATASIYSYAHNPMSKAAALSMLSAFSQRMRNESSQSI